MAALPYITATGNIEKALNGIKNASTPDSVSQDFVKTILGIKGGSGNQVTSYLKKIGFAGTDGKPTDIYTQFRNSSTTGQAAAAALRYGYGPLFERNEYMYKLKDADLRGLIIEETGAADDSNVPGLVLASINALKLFSKFDDKSAATPKPDQVAPLPVQIPPLGKPSSNNSGVGLNLSYTINLNLPATSDIAVFNAIFKSLKDNLLRSTDG